MKFPSAKQLKAEIVELAQEMSDPAVGRQPAKARELAHSHAEKQKLLKLVEQLEYVQREQTNTRVLLAIDDAEVRVLAEEDEQRLVKEEAALVRQIEEILMPPDPRNAKDIILEIRAGAGGEEAALFANELFRAYTRFAEEAGWSVHIVSKSMGEKGGFKEVIAEVGGKNVFGTMKYEQGVHRVQRVPATEKQGRIHTSTITVAVLPQAEEVDIDIRPEDLRVDTYRASGAGGQHVNKTSSAVRITHVPTNTVVAVQEERSQHKNREKAMRLLRSRLLDAQLQAQHQQEASERRRQVGTGDRSEKIRTYNFPQDRITDHRIKKSWSNIAGVMEGHLQEIFQTLRSAGSNAK